MVLWHRPRWGRFKILSFIFSDILLRPTANTYQFTFSQDKLGVKKGLCPLEKSLEMPHYMICHPPPQKKKYLPHFQYQRYIINSYSELKGPRGELGIIQENITYHIK